MAPGKHLLHNAARAPCKVCGQEGLPCARCRCDYYCGKEHQRQDWQRHRNGCGVMLLRSDQRLGRHLVAVKNIPAGTVIMREVPLLTCEGPIGAPKGFKCMSCYRRLDPRMLGREDGWEPCAACNLPVCSKECSQSPVHSPECGAFQRANFKLPAGEGIDRSIRLPLMALRACLASEQQPRLLDLQSDVPALPECPVPPITKRSFVSFATMNKLSEFHLREKGHTAFSVLAEEAVDWLHDRAGIKWIPRQELKRGLGTCILNIISAEAEQGQFGAVYAGLSMLEHSCVGNVTHCCAGGSVPGEVVVVTSRPVARGEHLSVDYTNNPLRSREFRRDQLIWRGFYCRCDLCTDPTERGLFMGSWCCQRCAEAGRKSLTLKQNDSIEWRCQYCDVEVVAGRDVVAPLEASAQELTALRHDPAADQAVWEDFIWRQLYPRGPLHDTHYHLLWAKQEIVLRPVSNVKQAADLEALARRAAHCQDLLCAMDQLDVHCELRNNLVKKMFTLVRRRLGDVLPPRLRSIPREMSVMKELTALVERVDNPVYAITEKEFLSGIKKFYEYLTPFIANLRVQPHYFKY